MEARMGQKTVGKVQAAIKKLHEELMKTEGRAPTRKEIDDVAELVNWEEFEKDRETGR
jgi:hypothetical protein